MKLEGSFALKAPIWKIWESLLEPGTLLACIPGAQKIERVDEKTYDCIVKQKVGPIAVKFQFRNIVSRAEPPTHLEMEGEGYDTIAKAGHFVQKSVVDLRETADGVVEVSYRTDVNIVGKLAMFGDRIMRAKAKQTEEEFTSALRQRLGAGA
ncbi:MAG: CoxG family protein [Thermodesulfobacteriota bacterium]